MWIGDIKIKSFINHVHQDFIRVCRSHERYLLNVLWEDTPDARENNLYDCVRINLHNTAESFAIRIDTHKILLST